MTAWPVYDALPAAFATHEPDAVKRHEWRLLPLPRALPERTGERILIWLHVPLLRALLHLGAAPGGRAGLSAFAVIHVGPRWLLRNHPACELNNPSSWGLIPLTGALGGAHLLPA